MFDMDGVLADFIGGYRKLQTTLGREQTFSTAWDAYWDKDVWQDILTSTDWWAKLSPIPDPHTFERIADLHYAADVYFVTRRPGVEPRRQTTRWLRDRGIHSPTVIISARKAEIAQAIGADFSIEDKAGSAVAIQYMAPKTKSFIVDRPYNQFNHDVLGSKVIRIKSVDEFLDAVVKEI